MKNLQASLKELNKEIKELKLIKKCRLLTDRELIVKSNTFKFNNMQRRVVFGEVDRRFPGEEKLEKACKKYLS